MTHRLRFRFDFVCVFLCASREWTTQYTERRLAPVLCAQKPAGSSFGSRGATGVPVLVENGCCVRMHLPNTVCFSGCADVRVPREHAMDHGSPANIMSVLGSWSEGCNRAGVGSSRR